MNWRGGICSERLFISERRGVVGGCASFILMSSLDVLRDASMIWGDGESFEGVPPPSDMDRVLLARGDLSVTIEWASAPARSLSQGGEPQSVIADSSIR